MTRRPVSKRPGRARDVRGREGPVLWIQALRAGGVVACAFLALSLASYHPEDPCFSRAGGTFVANWGGRVGAWSADLLLLVFGWASWAVVLGPLPLIRRLAGRPALGWTRAAAALVTLVAACAVLAMALPGNDPPRAGGLLGLVVSGGIRQVTGVAGAWLIVVGGGLFGAVLAAGLDIQRGAALLLNGLERVPGWSLRASGFALGGAWAGMRLGSRGLGALLRGLGRGLLALVRGTLRLLARRGAPRALDAAMVEENSLPSHRGSSAPETRPAGALPADAAEALTPLPPERPTRSGERPTLPAGRVLVEVDWEPTVFVEPEAAPERTFWDPDWRGDTVHAPDAVDGPTDRFAASPVEVMAEATGEEDPLPARSTSPLDAPDPSGVPVVPRPGRRNPLAGAPPPPPMDTLVPGSLGDEPASRRRAPSAGAVTFQPGDLVSGGTQGEGRVFLPTDPTTPFELPTLSLLDRHERDVAEYDEDSLRILAASLSEKIRSFGIEGEVVAIRPGPVITIFELLPAPGVKISRIAALQDDIAMAMKALKVRIVAPIPGKGVVGIEIPNQKRQTVWIRDVLSSPAFRESGYALPLCLGKGVEGRPVVSDLSRMPHLLVGGATGSGKSVGMNAMMLSLIYTRTPDELRFILIDPKMLEFEPYRDIPHLLHPVVTEVKLAAAALRWACEEMDRRYHLLARWGARNVAAYNRRVESEAREWTEQKARQFAPLDWSEGDPLPGPEKLPYIVIVIDELADLMMQAARDVEESVVRLSQKARAAGLHLIVATQRPSVDVVTGLIKANMPARIAFAMRTRTDGRTILDQNGAETLLGNGDMLFLPPGVNTLERVHGAFVADDEVRRVTEYLRGQGGPRYEADIRVREDLREDGPDDDIPAELYDLAVRIVSEAGKASTSMIQRHLKIGYNRAANIIDRMEREGIVGPADGARPREVLLGPP
ncbi:MAG: DNA translocase FtsK 4TM domain-containing protein [Deltaproteobacteria bacterium]|nr:DNA translocase FtsK 4TM domain-containing protein [Deltaproteobacteria bacterium]